MRPGSASEYPSTALLGKCGSAPSGGFISNLDSLIPASSNNNPTTWGINVLNDADRSVMFRDLSGLTGLNIVHSASIVGSC